jgi:hypothetical protein
MGLKSGSSGDPFGDDEEESGEEQESEAPRQPAEAQPPAETPASGGHNEKQQETTDPTTAEESESKPSIPYIYRRSKVNEGRDQVPFFLREHVRDGEDDLIDAVEGLVGEDIPKSDVREAAMLVAQEHPTLVADKLREWGYDYQ